MLRSAPRVALSLLSRVPGIVWVVGFILALVAGGAWGIYRHGVRAGETTVQRAALTDSVRVATAHVDTATRKTDSVIVAATKAERISRTARTARQQRREDVAQILLSMPPEVVQLVAADDAQIEKDSITIAVQGAAIHAFLAERFERVEKDGVTVRLAELEAKRPRSLVSKDVAIVAGTVAALLALGAWAF